MDDLRFKTWEDAIDALKNNDLSKRIPKYIAGQYRDNPEWVNAPYKISVEFSGHSITLTKNDKALHEIK